MYEKTKAFKRYKGNKYMVNPKPINAEEINKLELNKTIDFFKTFKTTNIKL